MAAYSIVAVNEDKRPLAGVAVEAVDLTDRTVSAVVTTDRSGEARFTGLTGPHFFRPRVRRTSGAVGDRSYTGRVDVQVVALGESMCVDYVVEADGMGTHTTLSGTDGAYQAAVAATGVKTIWMCNSETFSRVEPVGAINAGIYIIGPGRGIQSTNSPTPAATAPITLTALNGTNNLFTVDQAPVGSDSGLFFQGLGFSTDTTHGIVESANASQIDNIELVDCVLDVGCILISDGTRFLNDTAIYVESCKGDCTAIFISKVSSGGTPVQVSLFNNYLHLTEWYDDSAQTAGGAPGNWVAIGGSYVIDTGLSIRPTQTNNHILFSSMHIKYTGANELFGTPTSEQGLPLNLSFIALDIEFDQNSGVFGNFRNSASLDYAGLFIDGVYGYPDSGGVPSGTFLTIGTDWKDVYVGDFFGRKFSPQYSGPAGIGSISTLIRDIDGDTSVDVEKTADEDIIHFNAGGVVDIMTIATHGVDIHHTATESDEHALELEVDAAGFGDVKAVDIAYDTGTLGTGEAEAIVLINLNEIDAAGGDIFGFLILSTEGGANEVFGLGVGALVGPIHQDSGTFANPTTGTNNTASTDVAAMIDGSTGTNTTIFVADNDFIIIGAAAAFTELEFNIETGAAQPGIKPTFAYSTVGSGQFTTFSPIDGTNGFRNTGIVAWEVDELTGHVTNDDTGTFDIKITRTHAVAGSVSLFFAKTATTVVYSWDKDGDVTVRELQADLYNFGGGDSTLTIASGDVTVTKSYHTIAGESGAADNLDGIVGGSDGDLLTIRPSSDSVTITVRHNQNAAATKNILLNGDSNIALDDEDDTLTLLYDAALDTNGAWIEFSRGDVSTAIGAHNILSATHGDSLAASVVDGDVMIGNVTPAWSRLAVSIPAANVRNVLGIDNGEVRPSWKTALDGTNPADIAASASPGTSLVFAHRDHVHDHPDIAADIHTVYFLADGTRALSGDIDLDGNNIDDAGVFFLREQAAADGDVANQGQLWMKTGAPTEFMFTDDAGNDRTMIWAGGAFHDGFSDFVANEHLLVGAINHDALLNFVANDHIDHTSITLTAGVGLSGGGDISAGRTFTVDLNELATETSPDATVDFVAMVDATDSGSGKVLMGEIPPGYPTETAIATGDLLVFVDISETPDAANKITFANLANTLMNEFATDTIAAGDFVPFIDISETPDGGNKLTFANFEATLNHDNLAGFVANEHLLVAAIDHDALLNFVAGEHIAEGTIDHGSIAGLTDDDHGHYYLVAGDTPTGVHDFGGATSLELPNSATPTVNADGEIAVDTTITDFSHGLIRYFSGEELVVVAVPTAQIVTPTGGHVVSYNATNDEFELVAAAGGGGGTHSIWAQVHSVSGAANHPDASDPPTGATRIGSTSADGVAYWSLRIPSDFSSLDSAVIVCYALGGTGTLRYSISSGFDADGIQRFTTTDSIAATNRSMTNAQLDEIDISAAFTGLAANDIVSLSITRVGTNVADTLSDFHVLGVHIEYTPS